MRKEYTFVYSEMWPVHILCGILGLVFALMGSMILRSVMCAGFTVCSTEKAIIERMVQMSMCMTDATARCATVSVGYINGTKGIADLIWVFLQTFVAHHITC